MENRDRRLGCIIIIATAVAFWSLVAVAIWG